MIPSHWFTLDSPGKTKMNRAAMSVLNSGLPKMEERFLIWFNTRLVIGRYFFDAADGLVTVRTEHGSKTIQNGGVATKLLAKLMLRELAEEGKA